MLTVESHSEPARRRRNIKPRTPKVTSLLVIGICMLDLGCQKGRETIWKAESRSPDGLWLAGAETVQNGGFGSGAIQTSVYLKRINVSRPPMQVLEFSCPGPAPRPYVLDNNANAGGTIGLTMKWLTPTHLEVTQDGRGDLDFQVAKYGGVAISVRDLSDTTVHPSQ
jgi:hypothetical protein